MNDVFVLGFRRKQKFRNNRITTFQITSDFVYYNICIMRTTKTFSFINIEQGPLYHQIKIISKDKLNIVIHSEKSPSVSIVLSLAMGVGAKIELSKINVTTS